MTERSPELQAKLADLPTNPGVYLHKDAAGKILYVGKAKNLRNRVRTYFQKGSGHDAKTKVLVSKIVDLDWIITRSEVEALLVESNFIKQYRPPYNVVLRDDKQYVFIKITNERWPRLTTARQTTDTRARYFGPYTNAWAVRQTLKTLRKAFPYCLPNDPCDDKSRKRPCLYYHLGLCPSPQYGHISDQDYQANIDRAAAVLDGKADELHRVLQRRMETAAEKQQFETAAAARDQLSHLDALLHQQQVVTTKPVNRDVIGLSRDEGQSAVVLMTVRRGRVVAQKQFTFWGSEQADSSAEVLDSFLAQYYKAATSLPDEVLVPVASENARPVSDYLSERKDKRIPVEVPKRGERKRLMELAMANADEYLRQLRGSWMRDEAKRQAALSGLKQELKLHQEPARIECYDISHLSGTATVGSMVVFRNGESDSGHYRRFQIKHVAGIDDFASMQEVLKRRFARLAKGNDSSDESFRTRPDLVVIDGGKGQVSAAAETLADCGLSDVPMIGLAKRLEEVVVRRPDGSFDVHTLPPDSEALYLLQRIRDEAHRFAITYNRAMRRKRGVRSALDDLPGIGPTRKKQLLRKFGSVARIKEAELSEIQAVIGQAAGQVVKENL